MSLLLAMAVAAAAISPDCSDTEFRALDFWIGEWTVFDAKSDRAVAKSSIEAVADGCGIRENYQQSLGPAGKPVRYLGASFSSYDKAAKVWRQFYIDSRGSVTSFSGNPESGGAMVLVAPEERMTLRAEGDKVRQIGEGTKDGGATWTPQYDFTYIRSTAHPPEDR